MLCTTSSPFLWAKIGFVTYTILPALGLHILILLTGKKWNLYIVYFPFIVFSLIALFMPNFVVEASCERYFVSVSTFFTDLIVSNPAPVLIYWFYYSSYILFVSVMLLKAELKEKNKFRKEVYLLILAGILVSLVPAVVILIISPSLSLQFNSIYCQFAFLFIIIMLIAIYISYKHKK
jgi:hypothetical protein